MMPNKIILLTIFLYITLNLRKIENFIQSGCKIESFTEKAQKATKEEKKEKEERETIQEIKTNEMEETKTRAVYSILYLVGILVIMYLLGRDGNSTTKILGFFTNNKTTLIWVMTLIVFIILVSVTIAAYNAEDMDSEEWKALIWIESLISEIISVLTIFVAVKIVVTESGEGNAKLTVMGEKILEQLTTKPKPSGGPTPAGVGSADGGVATNRA